MTFQFYNPAPVLWELNALAPAAGGSVQFYAIGTTTPKTTWADFAKTIPNANPVTLDSAGRPNVPLWLDGDYSVTIRDSDGITIDTFDLRDPATGGTTIPPLVSGRFLTNNGTSLSWATIRQLPDPTGQAGKVVTTDGANFLFTNLPTPPALPVDVTANGISIGDGTERLRIICGTDTAPSSGTNQTTKAITFGVTFLTPPIWIDVKVNKVPISGVALVATAITNITTTGCTATFDTADRHFAGNAENYINASFPFTWIAIGAVSP
jgi:hypothetical protein